MNYSANSFSESSLASLRIPSLLLAALVLPLAIAARCQVAVDLSVRQGRITHGASGWLYGQAEDGIPSDNMMVSLKPQIAAQKPPDGLQHPTGDALQVAPAFRRAGGKEIEIYLQDVYPNWPYDNAGIDDYLQKVRGIVRKVAADPNHDLFSYVPFNEPDNNWYGYSGEPLEKFFEDWKAVYIAIRAIDHNARIVGPNFSIYRSETYRQFLRFARDNQVLPDEVSWHELLDDFYPGWDDRYRNYREIESSLHISPLPIVINEYARATGDLGVPGELVKWISRLEKSNVRACLAFWGPSGSLSGLVAKSSPNQATGAWWLYKWYGSMTGDTVAATVPDIYGNGLQVFATVDDANKQARIIFGGSTGAVVVDVRGLGGAPFSGRPVHVAVWRIASSGTEPSKGPGFIQEGNFVPVNDSIAINVPQTESSSAYQLIVSPATNRSDANRADRYKAEYADLFGSAAIKYGDGKDEVGPGFVEGYAATGLAATEFTVNALHDGYYELTLHYSLHRVKPGILARVGLSLNGAQPEAIDLREPAAADSWTTERHRFFLTGGINRFRFQALPDGSSGGLRIDSIDLMLSEGEIATYKADDPGNTISGACRLSTLTGSGNSLVTQIGGGDSNFLQFNHVDVAEAGNYKMIVWYTNDEQVHGGQVERLAEISINGQEVKKSYFRNTFDASVIRTNVLDVMLNKGKNTIRFSSDPGFAPSIVEIQIARP